MARKTQAKRRVAAGREFHFQPKLVSLAVATASGMMIAPVGAQESAPGAVGGPVIEEVVVTGFRRSLQDAMRLKRDNDLIVEAISAEDIGKLPDNSIAEALTRLTGLAGQRLNGRQQVISVRGLAPDFSTALLNGRQQVSAGDNRGVEFDQYPSELLSGVVVYKTPAASLTGQGLAGTIDMRVINPLDYGERTLAANVRYEWNEVDALNPESSDNGWRYSLSYIDQFADDSVGIALGYAHIGSPGQRENLDVWGYQAGAAGVEGADLQTGAIVKAQSSKLERDSFIGVLQYDPSETVTTKVDLYYSDFDERTLSRQFEMPLFPNWFGTSLSNVQSSDGIVQSATIDGVKAVLGNNLDNREAELWAVGWNLEASLNERWAMTFDISHSAIDREEVILSLNSGTGPQGMGALDTIGMTVGDNGVPSFSSTLDYTDTNQISLTSPQGWGAWGSGIAGGQVGYDNRPSIDDELTQIRLSAERYFDGPISRVEVGVQYDERTKSKINSNQGFLGFADGSLSKPLTSTGVVSTPYGLPGIAAFDPEETFASGIYYRVDNFHSGVVSNDWTVDEEVTLVYLEFGIDTSLGPIPVTGNFGIQMVHTDQSSTGSSAQQGQALSPEQAGLQEITGGTKYTEYLPSLNLNFEVAEQTFVRLGAARTLARARMDHMRAGRQVSFNASLARSTDIAQSPWGGDGGNPELKPWVANAVDLSVEWYFPEGLGYFALAGFYKDLRTYVYDRSILADFSEFPTGAIMPALTTGLVTRPDNGEGGEMLGLEFSLQVSGELLAPALAGFGAVFNASLTDSEIERGTGDPNTPLPGLSDEVVNLTLYYEKGGFSARVSNNYRSEFLGEVAGFGAARTERSIAAQELLDAQVSYSFDSGRFDGLTLFFQGTNLTDEPFYSYLSDDKSRIKDYQIYGRTYFLGLSYKY